MKKKSANGNTPATQHGVEMRGRHLLSVLDDIKKELAIRGGLLEAILNGKTEIRFPLE